MAILTIFHVTKAHLLLTRRLKINLYRLWQFKNIVRKDKREYKEHYDFY